MARQSAKQPEAGRPVGMGRAVSRAVDQSSTRNKRDDRLLKALVAQLGRAGCCERGSPYAYLPTLSGNLGYQGHGSGKATGGRRQVDDGRQLGLFGVPSRQPARSSARRISAAQWPRQARPDARSIHYPRSPPA